MNKNQTGGMIGSDLPRPPVFVPRHIVRPEVDRLWYRAIAKSFVQELWWLLVGRPKSRLRGKWVFNSADRTWRYYEVDFF